MPEVWPGFNPDAERLTKRTVVCYAAGRKEAHVSQVRIAIIGAGQWGRNLVRVAQDLAGSRLVAVCDSSPARLAACAWLSPRARLSSNANEVFDAPDVDAVLIATPASSHASLAVAALAAGKHVFVEKPMALSYDDAQRMLAAAASNGRRLMVGHLMLFHPAIVRMRALLRSGVLGEARSICSQRLGPPSPQRDEGFWWSLAPHDLSIACRLLASSPTRVSVRRFVPAPDHDLIRARLEFPGTREATIVVGTIGSEKLRRLTVIGELGMLRFDDSNGRARLTREVPGSGSVEVAFDRTEPLKCELQHFADALLHDAPIESDAAEGARVVRLLEAGARALNASAQAGSATTWSGIGGQLAS
jgi:predicted dehydrogenase